MNVLLRCARLSQLAYKDHGHGGKVYKSGSHECAVFTDKTHCFVAFRGTEGTADIVTDLRTFPWPIKGGVAHAGMRRGVKRLMKKMHIPRDLTVIATGHSLGGGMAAIAAQMYPDTFLRAVTFGAPPSMRLFKEPRTPILNVIHKDDPVPRLRLLGLFKHQGETKFVPKGATSGGHDVYGVFTGTAALCTGMGDDFRFHEIKNYVEAVRWI